MKPKLDGTYKSFAVVDSDGILQCDDVDGRDFTYENEASALASITPQEKRKGFLVVEVVIWAWLA